MGKIEKSDDEEVKIPDGPGPQTDLTDQELADIRSGKARCIDGEAYYGVNGQKRYGRFKSRHSEFEETDEGRRWFNSESCIHRDRELPAEVYTNGTRKWFIHGRNCRLNPSDPAIIFPDGSSEGRATILDEVTGCRKTVTIWTEGAPDGDFKCKREYTGVPGYEEPKNELPEMHFHV